MSQAKKGIASSSGWKFKSEELELKSRCTSLIIMLNQPLEQTVRGHDKFSHNLSSSGEGYISLYVKNKQTNKQLSI